MLEETTPTRPDAVSRMDEAMAVGQARYSDALVELAQFGPAEFTQTGGMCAALRVTLERGFLLVTDADDSLPWDREELAGWGVGYYRSDDASDGPEVFVGSDDVTVAALADTVVRCLREATATFGAGR